MTEARYALYHGCLIPARAPYLERATKLVLDDLGIGHEDLTGTSCCVDPTTLRGGTPIHPHRSAWGGQDVLGQGISTSECKPYR